MRTLILLGLAVLSFSQTFDENDPRAIIEKVKIYRLTKDLDLTTEQAILFFPKLNELQKIEQNYLKNQTEILHEFKKLLNNGAADQEIVSVIKKYEDAYFKKIEEQKKKLNEMKKILSPSQQARYLIFEAEFEREIRAMIKEIKEQRLKKP